MAGIWTPLCVVANHTGLSDDSYDPRCHSLPRPSWSARVARSHRGGPSAITVRPRARLRVVSTVSPVRRVDRPGAVYAVAPRLARRGRDYATDWPGHVRYACRQES